MELSDFTKGELLVMAQGSTDLLIAKGSMERVQWIKGKFL